MKVNWRMAAVDTTSPYVAEPSVVSTPEYWTVLKTLSTVARSSRVRISEKCCVFENDMLTATVPGPGMEKRDAEPYPLSGGFSKAALLNQLSWVPPPEVREMPGTRSGRSEPALPRATSATAAP